MDPAPLCERCEAGLQTLASCSEQLRETRERLAGAAKADWRILKAVPAYLQNHLAALEALEADLGVKRSRVERFGRLLRSARTPSG